MSKSPLIGALICFLLISTTCRAELTPKVGKELQDTYQAMEKKRKGPFSINYCTCENGKLAPVADANMRVRPDPCRELENSKQLFCSAYRNDLAKKLGEHGLYVANIFSNEVFLWDTHTDHHRLAKGFIFEKFYLDTHPEAKLNTSRAYGGISGAEFEARYGPRFFQKYYSLPDWNDFQHYLVQYELQRRYFLRGHLSLINDIRNLTIAIYTSYRPFKPVKDLVHNRLCAAMIPLIEDFQRRHPQDEPNRENYQRLIGLIKQLTGVDASDLEEYPPRISQTRIKEQIRTVLALGEEQSLPFVAELSRLMVMARRVVAARDIPAAEAMELTNINCSANLILHVTLSRLMQQERTWTVKELLTLQRDLIGAAYGAGLLSSRELEAARQMIEELLSRDTSTAGEALQLLNRTARVAEWAQNTVRTAFQDVWGPWLVLFPDISGITDDIIRSSPLLSYGALVKAVRGLVLHKLELEHHVLGKSVTEGIRALNPGVAAGQLRFFSDSENYSRDDIMALESTSADLEPVAGIITRDEGNIVSHVQLLARALGIPNAIFLESLYADLWSAKGTSLYYAITPMGRVILKETGNIGATEKRILAEYQRRRGRDGEVRSGRQKLAIDLARLDLKQTAVLPLTRVRRRDSGVICGPKAAFLGELLHFSPDNVSRGLVIPFGIFQEHFKSAAVAVPDELKAISGLADAAMPLPVFVRRTYDVFFQELLTDPAVSTAELQAWIKPRLEIIRHSIRNIVLNPTLEEKLRVQLAALGLFSDEKQEKLTGLFIRSDTNVEDLPNFSGAGLNLTLFNVRTLADLLQGIKAVWASPFTYRAFSWRQTALDDPHLVFPSILLLESVPSEKSGVLITADVDTGDQTKMTVATAEGVGGTVDGSAAETLIWNGKRSILLAQFKAPQRRILVADDTGGSRMAPSTGAEYVLTEEELQQLVAAAEKIRKNFVPAISEEGETLAWDIEYGFKDGHLFLFQVRPFIGDSELRHLPALTALDKTVLKKVKVHFLLTDTVIWRQ